MHHEEVGRGDPVVFVHGSLCDYRTWRAQLASIGATRRAIALSRRYHWPNEPPGPGEESTMATAVSDLADFLREIDAAPAHLVGNSWGAFTSLRLAIRRPELVRSLTLCEPPVLPLFVSMPPRPGELLRVLVTRPGTGVALLSFGASTIGPVEKLLRAGRREEAMDRFVRGVLGGTKADRLPAARRDQMRDNLAEFESSFLSPRGFDPLTALEVSGVDVPTLLVTGGGTPAIFVRLTDALARLLPRCERVSLPGASHLMHEDSPDSFNAALLAFLDRVDAGRSPATTGPER